CGITTSRPRMTFFAITDLCPCPTLANRHGLTVAYVRECPDRRAKLVDLRFLQFRIHWKRENFPRQRIPPLENRRARIPNRREPALSEQGTGSGFQSGCRF